MLSEHLILWQEVLVNVETAFKSALKRAGIEDFHFHNLHHTFASQLIMRGGTLEEVQEILGHKTMAMTLRAREKRSRSGVRS